jgi:mannose-6-phosphate isomerase-like protein (cupin superfamily)
MSEVEGRVRRAGEFGHDRKPWGELLWGVSGGLGNSETMTVGWCVLEPGAENPRHYHPNCDEVLVVVEGRIAHTYGDEMVELGEGDAISLPQGVTHNARNVGAARARLLICFSSADRLAVNV